MASAGRVLVVDDDEVVRHVLRDTLEEAGYHVNVLDHSKRIVAAVRAHAPDVILLDVMMPEWNGVDALTALAMLEARPAVVMMSAYLSGQRGEAWVTRARELGATLFLQKPFSTTELLGVVAEALGERDG
jgi:CheY-like chemotaxis protein